MSDRRFIDLAINERFREERKRLGLCHEATAEICGVSKTTSIAWTHGTKLPAGALAALVPHGLDLQYVVLGTRRPLSLDLVVTGQRQALRHLQHAMHALTRACAPTDAASAAPTEET